MNFKEIAKEIFDSFFVIFTCTILGVSVYLRVLGAESVLIRDIAGIFVTSVLGALAAIVLYSKNEHKSMKMPVRFVIHLLVVLVITLTTASFMGWVNWGVPVTVFRFTGLIIGIFAIVHAIVFFQTKNLADKMNEKLKERYK